MATNKKVQAAFFLSSDLKRRIETFLDSEISPVKTRQGLVEIAIIEYLEREEPILEMLKKERDKIRQRYL